MTQMQLELEPRPSPRPLPTGDNELARAMDKARKAEAHKERTGWYSEFMAREFPPPNVNKRRRSRETGD